MADKNYIQIGYTKKTHGVTGELKVLVEEPYEDIFLEADRVFLEIRGSKQPFFIESIRGGGDLIVKFEDVQDREAALLLQSKGIFLPGSEVPENLEPAGPELQYAGLKGYLLIDQIAGALGVAEEILEMPQQEMAVIHYKGREVWVPLNDQFIQAIDPAAREVRLDLPDGLLEL